MFMFLCIVIILSCIGFKKIILVLLSAGDLQVLFLPGPFSKLVFLKVCANPKGFNNEEVFVWFLFGDSGFSRDLP